MRRRMRSASSSAVSCASASDIQRGNDTRNRSPTSAASTCLRRRVPRTSSISMTPSISSRCDSSCAVRSRRRSDRVASDRTRAAQRYRSPCPRASTRCYRQRENRPRGTANFCLTARGARSYCRRCRFAAASTPDLPPGGLGTGARAAGRTEPFGAACDQPARSAWAPARACPRRMPAAEGGPRGDRSCDAAKTTRGLPASGVRPARALRESVAAGRYGRPACRPRRAARRSRSAPARRGHRAARAARDPRARRLRQDPRAHAPDRVPRAASSSPRPATCSRSRSPARPRASSSTGSARSASTTRSPRAPSTRSRSPSSGGRAADRRQELPRVLDRKARVLGAAPRRARRSGASVAMAIADVAAEIEWAKARLIAPERYAAAAARPPSAGCRGRQRELADLYAALRSREARATAGSTSTTSSAGAPTRSSDDATSRPRNAGASATCSSTSSRTRRRCRPRLLRAWLGDRADLCVVGDARAGDLRVRGRRRVAAHRLSRSTSPAAARSRSGDNYRSTDAIVAVAEAALGPASGVERDAAARCVRPTARPTIVAFDDDAHEAAMIADACWHEFTARSAVAPHGRAVPHQRAVVAVRDRVHPPRRPVPRRRHAAVRDAPVVRVLLDQLREAERDAPGAFVRRAPRRPRGRRRHRRRARGRTTRTDAIRRAGSSRPRPAGTNDDELRTHRDALLRLGRDYASGRAASRVRRRVRRLARHRDARRVGRRNAASTS